jgi:hypothetical protein
VPLDGLSLRRSAGYFLGEFLGQFLGRIPWANFSGVMPFDQRNVTCHSTGHPERCSSKSSMRRWCSCSARSSLLVFRTTLLSQSRTLYRISTLVRTCITVSIQCTTLQLPPLPPSLGPTSAWLGHDMLANSLDRAHVYAWCVRVCVSVCVFRMFLLSLSLVRLSSDTLPCYLAALVSLGSCCCCGSRSSTLFCHRRACAEAKTMVCVRVWGGYCRMFTLINLL